MTAAVLFLAAYAWPVLDPHLDAVPSTACRVVSWGAWALFVGDYAVRLALAESRRTFVRRHPWELALIVLPMLRPLRLLRLVTLLTVLNRRAGASLRGRVAAYVVGSTALVVVLAALGVLDAEQEDPRSSIGSFGDALWWSVTTLTTVGYGDRTPVTTGGRLVAVGLMVAGIALLGVVTATFASWLLDRLEDLEASGRAATRRDVEALSQQVAELRADLARALEGRSAPQGATTALPDSTP
jgi:voltage-gated potassium channel